jgi:diguanylate cyclase (GGDEF)-like protein
MEQPARVAGSASIVIVDDDPVAIQLIRKALAEYGDVRFATNGADAFRVIQARVPDLILLDGDMPGENGFQLCERLKREEALRDVPVIFVTAHNDLHFETQALSIGAADFIPKPVSAPRVQLRVKLHLQLKHQIEQLRTLANTDALTQLANRRVLLDTLERECARAMRTGSPVSLLLIDVDFFKLYNDAYGHPAGDRCLEEIAKVLAAAARRPLDLAARHGGEEFALALPDTTRDGALHVAEAVRTALAGEAIEHRASRIADRVTLSIGGCTWLPKARTAGHHSAHKALLAVADRALYVAKEQGRDRVEIVELSSAAGEAT